MSIETIPASFRYSCDVCGKAHLQENATGHYPDSRPPRWGRLSLKRQGAADHQGVVWTDGSIKRLLCDACLPIIEAAINEGAEKCRSPSTK